MNIRSPSCLEALKIIFPFIFFGGFMLWLGTFWSVFFSCFNFGFVLCALYFFRDPERKVPSDEKIIVAAADGIVVEIEEMEELYFTNVKMKRVAIFLSVFDVHINRFPVTGLVRKTFHKPGMFLDVRNPNSSKKNEYQAWLIESPRGVIVVRQIAGLIARRIVAWAEEGQTLLKGARFGMIRFGSRTEIYVPARCEILVKVGDRVHGASSPIARWP